MFIIYIIHHEDLPPWKLTCQLKKGPFQKGSDSLPSIIFQGDMLVFGDVPCFFGFLYHPSYRCRCRGEGLLTVTYLTPSVPRLRPQFPENHTPLEWSVSFFFFFNLGSVYPLISSIFVDGWVMMVSYFKSKCLEAFGKGLGFFREGIHFESGSWGMFLCYLRYIKDVCIYEFLSFFQSTSICKLIL